MKTRYDFSAEDYSVTVDFRAHTQEEFMSLQGVVDTYALQFPISEATKEKLKSALYKQAAEKINEAFRFATKVLHIQLANGNHITIDICFKQYYASFCIFTIDQSWHKLEGGKHSVMLYMNDYMANGCIEGYWRNKRRQITKNKNARL